MAAPTHRIRNGGLLLVLVALAVVVALVDEPPELGDGRHLPSIFPSLPPPTGITALPPAGAQPPPPGTTTPLEDAAAASARVPPVAVRVRPPALLGRDLPEVNSTRPTPSVYHPTGW
jgi:hypothetical protein